MANRVGVRVIVPLVDNWKWWGGAEQYAEYRGKPAAAFWTDPEIISDFKKTVNYILNRRNTLTGKLYKDANDVAENYLNVVETWLYRYPRDAQGKIDPTPYLAASTALTRAGGSIVVFSEQGKPTTTPPIAARLTAKRGIGGAVILFDGAGNEAKTIQAK